MNEIVTSDDTKSQIKVQLGLSVKCQGLIARQVFI